MNISSISYTSSTAYLYQTTLDSSSSDSSSSSSSSSDSIKSLFSSLSDALSSGDTSTASSLWSKLDSAFKAQSGQTNASSSTDASNPLQKDMAKLKAYIDRGDTTSATKMLSHIEKAMSRGGPGGPPLTQGDQGQAGTKISDLLSSIGSALTNGDTSTASSYLTQLDDLLASKSKDSSSSTDSTSSTSSAGNSSSTEQKNPLKEAIAQLQQYLQSGDTSSVQSLFQDIQRSVNHNSWTPELGSQINSFA